MGPWVWFRYIFGKKISFQLHAARDVECTSLGPRKLRASVGVDLLLNYSSFTATKSSIVLQYASWSELSVARGRSFYNAAVTWYKSDIPYTLHFTTVNCSLPVEPSNGTIVDYERLNETVLEGTVL